MTAGYVRRMEDEAAELSAKLNKLELFVRGEEFDGLPAIEQYLLDEQRKHMQKYLNTLRLRIGIAK